MTDENVEPKGDENTKENGENKDVAFETFEAFLESAGEPIKVLYNSHVSGLKNALEMEKDNRRKLSEQVRTLATQAEKGSELETKFNETLKTLQEAEQRSEENARRANFAEQAVFPTHVGVIRLHDLFLPVEIKFSPHTWG